MQKSEEFAPSESPGTTWNGVERRRVEKVVETMAIARTQGESLSEIAHDARNMVTALGLYCDLLEEPGVLATAFTHYAHELRLVAAASRRLVEKLVTLDANVFPEVNAPLLLEAKTGRGTSLTCVATSASASSSSNADTRTGGRSGAMPFASGRTSTANPTPEEWNRRWDLVPALPISNLAAELLANRNLLSALAGPSIAVTMEADGGAQAVRLSGEDLTRLLVNLVKNAAEAMPEARNQSKTRTMTQTETQTMTETMTQNRRIHIGLRERKSAQGAATCLELTVEDSGPGIAETALDRIFISGFTSRGKEAESRDETAKRGNWPQSHRGLGLAIVRSIVEGAGGRITASNRTPGGACFTLEFPVRKVGC